MIYQTILLLSFCLLVTSCQTISVEQKHSAEEQKEKSFETVTFQSEDSTSLTGLLFRPTGQGPFPAIVALHGCAGLYRKGGRINMRELDWGSRLAANGFVVIYPDSFTKRNIKEICRNKATKGMAYQTRPQDAYGALRWLMTLDYVKKNSIGIMGWSNGGSALLETIRANKLPKDLPDFKTAIAFYPGCARLEKDMDWSNRVPLEILIGELDNWTSPQPCLSLVERLKEKTKINITVYPDSYHDFDAPDMPLKEVNNLTYASGSTYTATIGTNEKARSDSIKKVLDILKNNL